MYKDGNCNRAPPPIYCKSHCISYSFKFNLLGSTTMPASKICIHKCGTQTFSTIFITRHNLGACAYDEHKKSSNKSVSRVSYKLFLVVFIYILCGQLSKKNFPVWYLKSANCTFLNYKANLKDIFVTYSEWAERLWNLEENHTNKTIFVLFLNINDNHMVVHFGKTMMENKTKIRGLMNNRHIPPFPGQCLSCQKWHKSLRPESARFLIDLILNYKPSEHLIRNYKLFLLLRALK